jgi:CRISPR-associated endonuclease Csn1
MNRFAFDLGTNSIGWAVLDVSNPEFPEIAKDNRSDDDGIGVRIFPDGRVPKKGIPLNEARRTARQMRVIGKSAEKRQCLTSLPPTP